MTFISRKVRLLQLIAVCCLLAVTGCTPSTTQAAPIDTQVSASPRPSAIPRVRPKPKPTQRPLPASIDTRSIAAAKQFGWAIDADKSGHRVRVLHYDRKTGLIAIALSVGASYGAYHRDCKTRTSCYTTNGQHSIQRKAGRYYKSRTFPRPNGGAPMPWATFFNGGQAFHYGSPATSHGCIHIFKMSAAKYIHNLPYGTPVVVHR